MQYFPNRNKLIAGLVASVLAFSSVQSLADIDQSRLDQISADIQARIDGDKLSGAVVMVAKDGEIEMNKAFGYQNVEDEIAMSTDSIFRIFSMTKPVTGTALMILHDEGKFDLDDAVEKHLPELANMQVLLTANDDGSFETEAAGHPMTVRELMSHTGGLLYTPPLSRGPVAEAYAKAGIMNLPNYTLAESIPELANIPLAYQPGSQWVYRGIWSKFYQGKLLMNFCKIEYLSHSACMKLDSMYAMKTPTDWRDSMCQEEMVT